MPMSRFEIRNEYGLADPVLYQAADKDDPEDVLEGVAMAGLVGLLRQLGDLAEFAAEIFHNLHDEVMSTAARGHGLIIRVQQLEAEVPFIEKAFLSHTDYSSLFNNAGVDWHPKIRLEHNVVSSGNVPRFVMDSCEGCRGPPRLFLLDKFDVAGAGACLKRYTDPSFFKVENSEILGPGFQKEKKIRKIKRRGPYGTNGETPEVPPTSHTKLRQLFQEESDKNVVGKHSHRAKLKRRLNGFPFDIKTGSSYMEKLLNSPTFDREVSQNSSSLSLDHRNSGLEVLVARPVYPDSVGRKSSQSQPSIDVEEIFPNSSAYGELSTDDKISRTTRPYSVTEPPGLPLNLDLMAAEKVIGIDGESRGEGDMDGYRSDDIASEVDSYADAHSTIDSDMDFDSDFRMQNDFTFPKVKTMPVISDAAENHSLSGSSDSLSPEDSRMLDEAGCSSKKNIASISGENISGYNTGKVKESYFPKTGDGIFQMNRQPNPILPDETCIGPGAVANLISTFEQSTSDIHSNGHLQTESGSVSDTRKFVLDLESCYTLDVEPKKTSADAYPQCSLEVFNFHMQSGDGFPTSSNGEYRVDEPIDDESIHSDSTQKHIQLQEAEASFSNSSKNIDAASGMVYSSGRLNAEFVELSNVISRMDDNEDDASKMTISEGESDFDMLDDEGSLLSADSPICFPCPVDISFLGEDHEEDEVDAATGAQPGSSSEDGKVSSDISKSKIWPLTSIDSSKGSSSKHETSMNGTSDVELERFVVSTSPEEQEDTEIQMETNAEVRVENFHIDENSSPEEDHDQGHEALMNGITNPCLDDVDRGTDSVDAPVEEHLLDNDEAVESVLQEKDVPGFSEEMIRPDEISAESRHLPPSEATPVLETNGASTFSALELPVLKDASLNGVFSVTAPDPNHVNLADLPPLPPLPPVQWRMGKFQLAGPSSPTVKPEDASLQLMSPKTASGSDDIDVESSQLTLSADSSVLPQVIAPVDDAVYPVPSSSDDIDITKQSQTMETCSKEIIESRVENSREEIEQNSSESFPENVSTEDKVENASTKTLSPATQNGQCPSEEQASRAEPITARSDENEGNNSKSTKQPLPRNPLVDDLATHDKSKLRKVAERIRPELKKLDERDSFLQQIRTKSFNLKPATPSRPPSVQGPNNNTNLRVAAILEKANAIRHALAGSDEDDDDDTWSDS